MSRWVSLLICFWWLIWGNFVKGQYLIIFAQNIEIIDIGFLDFVSL